MIPIIYETKGKIILKKKKSYYFRSEWKTEQAKFPIMASEDSECERGIRSIFQRILEKRRNFENKKISQIEIWKSRFSAPPRSINDDYEEGRDGDCVVAAQIGSPTNRRRSLGIQLQVPTRSLPHCLLFSFSAITGMCLPSQYRLLLPFQLILVARLCVFWLCDSSEFRGILGYFTWRIWFESRVFFLVHVEELAIEAFWSFAIHISFSASYTKLVSVFVMCLEIWSLFFFSFYGSGVEFVNENIVFESSVLQFNSIFCSLNTGD